MDKNKNFSACDIKTDKDIYKEVRTICKNCYKEKKRKNKNSNTLIQSQQQNNDDVNTNKNNRTVLVGPRLLSQTYLLLKKLSRILPDRDIYIITKPPPEQYSNSKIKIKEKTEEKKPLKNTKMVS